MFSAKLAIKLWKKIQFVCVMLCCIALRDRLRLNHYSCFAHREHDNGNIYKIK